MEVDLAEDGQTPQPVKLWARRVWTLELSLVRGNLTLPPEHVSLTRLLFRFDIRPIDTLDNIYILP